MTGPWGIALTAATIVLVPLISKMGLFGDKLDEGVEKLKKDADQTEATRKAKEAFGKTEEGVTAAIRDQKDALDKQIAGLTSEIGRAHV